MFRCVTTLMLHSSSASLARISHFNSGNRPSSIVADVDLLSVFASSASDEFQTKRDGKQNGEHDEEAGEFYLVQHEEGVEPRGAEVDVAVDGAEELGFVCWAPDPGFDEMRVAEFGKVVVVDDVSKRSTEIESVLSS